MSTINSLRKRKLAFVHLMRTGGTFVSSQFEYEGFLMMNSWKAGLKRDWTKEEAIEIAKLDLNEDVFFHNHIVNWDLEILKTFKENGWITFSVFRDPLSQLVSIHSYQTKGWFYDFKKESPKNVKLNNFIENQIRYAESILDVDYQHWNIPSWWREIDIVLDYEKELFPTLKRTFGLSDNFLPIRVSQYEKSKDQISDEVLERVESSEFHKRYLDFKGREQKKIFVLITSCAANQENRDLLRKGWIKDLNCPYLFVIGDEEKETRIEDDILYVNCGDSYEDCPIKQYLSIKYTNQEFEFDYLFCCDDDTYVIVERLIESGFENHDYFGGGPVWEQGDPYYVQGGAGIFLSKKAVKEISEYPIDGDHLNCRWSDQMVGKIMADSGIEPVYNKRFQMGHEEQIEWISRDYNRLITDHKINTWRIKHADIDVNPFHAFDKIYWIKINQKWTCRMQEQIEDSDIEHLIQEALDYKEAVRDAVKNNYEKILILKDDDCFVFKIRDLIRLFFYEEKDWEIMCLGAEAKRTKNKSSVLESTEVTRFSGLGLSQKWFENFLENDKSVEDWLWGKKVHFPERLCSAKDWFKTPEIVYDYDIKSPIKCAMIVSNFRRGGAEIEFNEMITKTDPLKVQWVGIAVESALQFEISPLCKDKFPPVYVSENQIDKAIDLDKANVCPTFEEAVMKAVQNADVIIKWHVNNPLVESLPHPSIALANTFGRWPLEQYREIKADLFVGNSDHSKSIFWQNSRTIYSGHSLERLKTELGRDEQREKWGFKNADKIVGYTGRIDMDKNLGTVIKAVSLLPEEYKLVFVGEPIGYEEVKTMLDKYLPGRHHVDPWSHCVGDVLSAIDCFVLVSDYEGFSNSLAEAWMLEIPAVFSRCGAVMELQNKYGDIGISVNTGVKPRQLSHSIIRAIHPSNKPIVEKIGKIMREGFSIEESAKQWELAIEDTAKKFQCAHKVLKVGLINPDESLNFLKQCSHPYLMKIKDIKSTNDISECDVIVVCKMEENLFEDDFLKPMVLFPGNNEFCHLADRCVAFGYLDKIKFPKIVRNSVDIMPKGLTPENLLEEDSLKKNGFSAAQQWYDYLLNVCESHNRNLNLTDLGIKINEMLETMKPKAVARQLNRDEIPPPYGNEWNYKSVLAFKANA